MSLTIFLIIGNTDRGDPSAKRAIEITEAIVNDHVTMERRLNVNQIKRVKDMITERIHWHRSVGQWQPAINWCQFILQLLPKESVEDRVMAMLWRADALLQQGDVNKAWDTAMESVTIVRSTRTIIMAFKCTLLAKGPEEAVERLMELLQYSKEAHEHDSLQHHTDDLDRLLLCCRVAKESIRESESDIAISLILGKWLKLFESCRAWRISLIQSTHLNDQKSNSEDFYEGQSNTKMTATYFSVLCELQQLSLNKYLEKSGQKNDSSTPTTKRLLTNIMDKATTSRREDNEVSNLNNDFNENNKKSVDSEEKDIKLDTSSPKSTSFSLPMKNPLRTPPMDSEGILNSAKRMRLSGSYEPGLHSQEHSLDSDVEIDGDMVSELIRSHGKRSKSPAIRQVQSHTSMDDVQDGLLPFDGTPSVDDPLPDARIYPDAFIRPTEDEKVLNQYRFHCSLFTLEQEVLAKNLDAITLVQVIQKDGYDISCLGCIDDMQWLGDLCWNVGCLLMKTDICKLSDEEFSNASVQQNTLASRFIMSSKFLETAQQIYFVIPEQDEIYSTRNQVFCLMLASALRLDAETMMLPSSTEFDNTSSVLKPDDMIQKNLHLANQMLRRNLGFADENDKQLQKIALILEFSYLCRTGSALLDSFVENRKNSFLELTPNELQQCADIATSEQGGSAIVTRLMLGYAIQKGAREDVPNYALMGELYSRLIHLSPTRQMVRHLSTAAI